MSISRSMLTLALAAGASSFSPGAAAQPSPSAQAASSPAPAPAYRPRVWPIVVGSLIFVPAYGMTVYWAFSGEATSYGRIQPGETEGEHDFGDPGLLLMPVIGPLLFAESKCSDAQAHYRSGDSSGGGSPDTACSGTFWQLDAAVQAIGVAFILGGLLTPIEEPRPASARVVLTPFAQGSRLGLAAVGSF